MTTLALPPLGFSIRIIHLIFWDVIFNFLFFSFLFSILFQFHLLKQMFNKIHLIMKQLFIVIYQLLPSLITKAQIK